MNKRELRFIERQWLPQSHVDKAGTQVPDHLNLNLLVFLLILLLIVSRLQHAPYTYLNDVPGWAPNFVKSKTELFDIICMQHYKIEFLNLCEPAKNITYELHKTINFVMIWPSLHRPPK